MARPLRRDVLAWVASIPTSLTLLVCLGLPQVRDCHGHVKTAADNGTSPLLVVMALVAIAPLAWRTPLLRRLVAIAVLFVAAIAVFSSLLVIPIGIYCLVIRPWRSTEQLVAFACGCIALVFVVVFPLVGLFSTWLYGAALTWACAWVVMAAAFAWASAARARAAAPVESVPLVEPALESAVELEPPRDPLPELVGDYAIEAELGAGGMARVYRGRHVHLETHHALKVLDPAYRRMPEARQRFLDEAKIQARLLSHPNIVRVTNIVATPEHAALVMDLVDGPSLDDTIPTLPGNPDEIRRIMLGILAAVDHAHRCGVIHRDLKPGNVLLDGPARIPRVTDFGIAKRTERSTTAQGARMGTLVYSSPEQLRDPSGVTARSDIWSLGVVLYEMATGVVPFRGACDLDVMNAIVAGSYFLPRVIDPQLARVIRRSLDPDPANRFATCSAMANALVDQS